LKIMQRKNKTIRILFATAEPCPTFRPDVTALFGKYLPREGVMSDVIAERARKMEEKRVQWGGGEALLARPRGGKVAKYLAAFTHAAYMMFRADRTRYHAFQVRDMPWVALAGLCAARWKKRPFFYWMSFPLFEGYMELARQRGLSAGLAGFLLPWLRGRVGRFVLYRIVLPRADHIFVQSERMRDDVAAHGVPRRKMTAVPMGVDLEAARPASLPPSEDPRLEGKRVLVYLGSLDRRRRIDLLFEMLVTVRRLFPDVLLVIAGATDDEPHQRWLRQRADALGVQDAVLWTGWLPVEQAWRYVRAAEVALSPIPRGPLLDCGSPTKTLEYLALGVPVVGNDNPDQKALLEEGGGGLCVPFTAEDFAGAVCRLLTDGDLRRSLAHSGQRHVAAKRTYATLAAALAERYVQLLYEPAASSASHLAAARTR
jgi:glycosyltransferase involved in cell wall biosynthesis